MTEVYKWNTGRQYTKNGQRIQAEVTFPDGEVLFMDYDRGIGGRLTEKLPYGWGMWSSATRINWIHNEYLHNRYQMAMEPMQWIPEGTFAQVRM